MKRPEKFLRLSFASKHAIKAIPGVLALHFWLKKKNLRSQLVTARTQVCLEGFPRSGNSLMLFCIVQILDFPKEAVAHHTHSHVNVRRAVSRGIPTFVLLRTPAECCSSLVVYGISKSLSDALRAYEAFYGAMLPLLDSVTILPTEEFFKKPSALLEKVARILNRPYLLDDVEARISQIEMEMRRAHFDGSIHMLSLPHPDKEQMKRNLWKQGQSSSVSCLLERCQRVHDRILASTKP